MSLGRAGPIPGRTFWRTKPRVWEWDWEQIIHQLRPVSRSEKTRSRRPDRRRGHSDPADDGRPTKQNKLAGGLANFASTPVSIVARAGAPKPDISSVEGFKHALLTARSIVYADPAKGGASGVYFARVLDHLGIADQLLKVLASAAVTSLLDASNG